MRAGYAVSIAGHLAILGFGFFAFPDGTPFTAEPVEALPVELVEVSDVTDLLEGDKNSRDLPAEKPQPKPEEQAEAPAPTPAEKPAEKPVETAEAPPPPPEPPPPKPEPAEEPEPVDEPEQVASLPEPDEEPLPPEAEPEPLPAEAIAPVVPAPRLPKARPKPPKPVAQPKPEPKKPEPKEPERTIAELIPKERETDMESLVRQALLNKQEPQGGGTPVPATEPQTIGSVTGSVDAAMTQSWIAALQSKLTRCWNPPVGVREAQNLIVSVNFALAPDGSLVGTPMISRVTSVSDPLSQVAADSAVRAVAQCAPYSDVFPAEHYEVWQSIEVDFNPRDMFGAG